MSRVLATLMLLLVAGCSTAVVQPPSAAEPPALPGTTAVAQHPGAGDRGSAAQPSVTPAAATPAASDQLAAVPGAAQDPRPWLQFGMVMRVRPGSIGAADDGSTEEAMVLQILLDSGDTLGVTQALSQAGRLAEGDRVRVLRIGDFTRVTFWPYGHYSVPGALPPAQ